MATQPSPGRDRRSPRQKVGLGWLLDWRVIAAAAICGGAGFFAATLIFQPPTKWHPDWGDFPTWFAFIAAFIAGGAALSQLRGQQRQIDEESARNRKRDELLDAQLAETERRAISSRRQQAELIKLTRLAGRRDGEMRCEVVNDSSRPIRDVACRVRLADGLVMPDLFSTPVRFEPTWPSRGPALTTLMAADETDTDLATGSYLHLLSGASVQARFDLPVKDPAGTYSLPYVIRFTDDARLRWQLDDNMHLEAAPDDEW